MKNIVCTLAALLALAHIPPAAAQASCSSDGTAPPSAVFERFISADCEACWSDAAAPAPSTAGGALVLDWIVPAPAGDDAPLSAAATPESLARLRTLGRAAPTTTDVFISPVLGAPTARIRVAHGLPFNDYIGAALSFAPARAPQGRAAEPGNFGLYLVLVESVPAGADGTAVARNVVRAVYEAPWNPGDAPTAVAPRRWKEARSMHIPDGTRPGRLAVVGWVHDTLGHVLAAAQSVCR